MHSSSLGAQQAPNLEFEVRQPVGSAHAHVAAYGSATQNKALQALMQKHQGYMAKPGTITCSIDSYKTFATALRAAPLPGVVPAWIPDFVLQGFAPTSAPASSSSGTQAAPTAIPAPSSSSVHLPLTSLDLPPRLADTMYRFQTEGVRFCAARRRALLADEMGLGKTVQAIAFAVHFHRLWPLLIIAPSSLRANWRTELTAHVPWLADAPGLIHVVEGGASKMPVPPEGFPARAVDSRPPWVQPDPPTETAPPSVSSACSGPLAASTSPPVPAAPAAEAALLAVPEPPRVPSPALPPSPDPGPVVPRRRGRPPASAVPERTSPVAPPGVAMATALLLDEEEEAAMNARGGNRASRRLYRLSGASGGRQHRGSSGDEDEDLALALASSSSSSRGSVSASSSGASSSSSASDSSNNSDATEDDDFVVVRGGRGGRRGRGGGGRRGGSSRGTPAAAAASASSAASGGSARPGGRRPPPPVPEVILQQAAAAAASASSAAPASSVTSASSSAPRAGRGGGPTRAAGAPVPAAFGPEYGVVIVSFDIVKTLVSSGKMRPGQFRVVVVDESHQIKEPTAQRTAACTPIIKAATAALLLSGTPALNRPKELFSQLHALREDLFRDYWAFAARYCDAKMRPWGMDVEGSSHLEELRALLARNVMMRRLKSEVESSLPPKRRRMYRVGHTTRGAAALQAIKQQMDTIKEAARRLPQGTAAAEAYFMQLQAKQAQEYHWAGIAKLPGVIAHILNLVRPLGKPGRAAAAGLSAAALDSIVEEAIAGLASGAGDGEDTSNKSGEAVGNSGGPPPAKRPRLAPLPEGAAAEDGSGDEDLDGFEALLAGMDSDGEGEGLGGGSGSRAGSRGGGYLDEDAPKAPLTGSATAHQRADSQREASAWRGVAAGLVETRPAAVVSGSSSQATARRPSQVAATEDGSPSSQASAAHVTLPSTMPLDAAASGGGGGGSLPTVNKLVVFGHHQTVLAALCRALEAHNPPLQYIRIDGSVTVSRRDALLRRFQTDPSVQVAVVSLKAAGVGLTFTAANVAVFAELDWVPGVLQQAEARIHRLGQRAAWVETHYLVGPDPTGLDMRMWESVARKLDVLETTLGAGSAAGPPAPAVAAAGAGASSAHSTAAPAAAAAALVAAAPPPQLAASLPSLPAPRAPASCELDDDDIALLLALEESEE